MRKIFGGLLIGLGAFLVMAAILGVAWAPGVVKKTPIDVNTTTLLTGEAARLDTATGAFDKLPIYAKSVSRVDSNASTDDTAVFVSTQCAVFGSDPDFACVDGSDPNLITASVDTFATDRTTGLSVESEALPADAVPHEGLVNKWPFDAQQKTYPYWDGTAGRAVDAVFDRTETVDGLTVNVYTVAVEDAPIDIGEGIPGTYDDAKELFVDPRTGSIVNQVDDQQRYLEDGTQVLDLQLAFTDDQVAANVKETKDNIASLNLLTRTVPLVGVIGGGLLILIGLFLLLRRRRTAEPVEVDTHRSPVGAGRH